MWKLIKRHWPFLLGLAGCVHYGSGMLLFIMTKGHAGTSIENGIELFSGSAALMGLSFRQTRHDRKINDIEQVVPVGGLEPTENTVNLREPE